MPIPPNPAQHRPPRHSTTRRLGWFFGVGVLAAGVHWAVVVGLVSRQGWPPLVANVAGWLVAFTVSFSGHLRLTFGDRGAPWRTAAPRFFLISAGGFGINEVLYAALLGWSGLRYDLLLAAVLVAVAGVTYLLSQHWAFGHSPGR